MSARKKRRADNRVQSDPNQTEFGIIWRLPEYPFRLRTGDITRYDDWLCRIIRVSESSARQY